MSDKLLFLDLETTGLVPEKTQILEIGAKIVDNNLVTFDTFHQVLFFDQAASLDAWCLATHTKSGLLDECRKSSVSISSAQTFFNEWLDQHFPDNVIKTMNEGSREGEIILCGTGIHFDRRYIRYHMPLVNERLHHRMIDVTAVYYANKVFGKKTKIPEKTSREVLNHRALSDIDDSINLLKALVTNE